LTGKLGNTITVIPAQAGIHQPSQVAVCYGFPSARERQWFWIASCVASVAALSIASTSVLAQNWPTRHLRIVVPYAAGSFTDVSARTIANELTSQLGQQVIVENRVGAGGTLGVDYVAKSSPDGYTMLLTDNSLAIAPALYAKLPYNPLKDFAQITQVAESPSLLMARMALPAKSLKEIVDLARSKPGELTFGSGGQGSSAHLAMELLLHVTGTRMTHVPYKGVILSIADVMAGRIDFSIASLASGMTHVSAGKIQGIAVSGKDCSALLPAVPTFSEAGAPDYDMSYWWGVAAPAGAPQAVVTRLNQEIVRASREARIRETFSKQGARPVTGTPAEMQRRVEGESKTWRTVIAKAGVKVE
jgi:tripartite-type tricarboxylate transporter receptor subunit TctC